MQLRLLMFTRGKTNGIVQRTNTEGIQQHHEALRAIVKEVETIKMQIEQVKLESGIQVDELAELSPGLRRKRLRRKSSIYRKHSFKLIIKQVCK